MMLTLMVTAGPPTGGNVASASSQYDLLARLAAGGMAEIFLARSNGLAGFERYVVLKRIRPERGDDARWVGMFLDEARLAAQLQHPNIAQVFDLGQIGEDYFYTMEYVHGEDLLDILAFTADKKQPMPVQVALAIIAGACAGLAHAHERRSPDGRPLGIVHRDISPSNLMVSYEGTVKVVDFGVAKARFRQTETQAGTIMGKIAYLSPEQCTTGDIDHRSDIFSLGIVLYEMLTGARLFKRESDFETLQAIARENPIEPSAVVPNLPRGLDDVVLTALAKDPDERYASAHAMLDALEQVAEGAGMSITGNVLRRYMKDLFGQREEPWRELERASVMELGDADVELIEESRPRLHGLPMNAVADEVPMLDSETGMIDLDALFGRDRSVIQTKAPPAPPVMPRASGPQPLARPPAQSGPQPVVRPPVPSGPVAIPTGSIVMVPLPVPNARPATQTSISRVAQGSADGVPYPIHVTAQTAAVHAPKRSMITVVLTAVGVVAAFVIMYVLVSTHSGSAPPASVSGSAAKPAPAGPTVTHIDEPGGGAAPANAAPASSAPASSANVAPSANSVPANSSPTGTPANVATQPATGNGATKSAPASVTAQPATTNVTANAKPANVAAQPATTNGPAKSAPTNVAAQPATTNGAPAKSAATAAPSTNLVPAKSAPSNVAATPTATKSSPTNAATNTAPKSSTTKSAPAATKPAAKPEPAKKDPAKCSDPLDCQF
ncbi:MAG: protein kinase [Kofleriaceae bacterium]